MTALIPILNQIHRCLTTWVSRRDIDMGRFSRFCAAITIWIIAAAVPLHNGIKLGILLNSGSRDEQAVVPLLIPFFIQVAASFVATLVVTITTGCYTQRLINCHGAINSQLSEVVDIGKKAMITAKLGFASTCCLQVSILSAGW